MKKCQKVRKSAKNYETILPDFGGRYGFPGFHRVFASTTGLESFSLRPEKFPKRFSFGGGRVRFFLLCIIHYFSIVEKYF